MRWGMLIAVVLGTVVGLLPGCCDNAPQPQKPREKTCEERIQETYQTLDAYAPTCYQLGACLGHDAAFVPDEVIQYYASNGTRYQSDGQREFLCKVGGAIFRMSEIGPAFRGCMAAKGRK
jgi:hypothetical protein